MSASEVLDKISVAIQAAMKKGDFGIQLVLPEETPMNPLGAFIADKGYGGYYIINSDGSYKVTYSWGKPKSEQPRIPANLSAD